jgi:hypothetical protein
MAEDQSNDLARYICMRREKIIDHDQSVFIASIAEHADTHISGSLRSVNINGSTIERNGHVFIGGLGGMICP